MDGATLTPRVLVLGLDPYRVPGSWDPEPAADGIEVGRARFIGHGVKAEFCLSASTAATTSRRSSLRP
jgi:hypothetical protein